MLKREKQNLLVILLLFEVSFFVRFVWDLTNVPLTHYYFAFITIYDIVVFFEGLSFFAMLLVHFRSFALEKSVMPSDSDNLKI